MNRDERPGQHDASADTPPDEITRDVDPAWLARITREPSTTAGVSTAGDEAGEDGEWSDEGRTIANEEVLDQIRAAVRAAQRVPASESAPDDHARTLGASTRTTTVNGAPPAADVRVPSAAMGVAVGAAADAVADAVDGVPAPISSDGAALHFPPPDPQAPIHTVKAAPIPVRPERWQPTQALKPATTLSAPALLVEDTTRKRRLDRTVTLIIAVAIVVGLAIGFVLSRTTDDEPAPTDDTTVTTDDIPGNATPTTAGTPAATTPVAPVASVAPEPGS